MTTFLTILTTIVLPITLVAGVGFLLGRTRVVADSRPLARVTLYCFSPALVLNSIARSRLSNADLFSVLALSLSSALLMGLLSYLLARLLNFDRLLTSAFVLSIMLVNAGNIGLPFNQFAFGASGLNRAVIFFVGNSILAQTLAIFIASRGRHSISHSAAAVFKMPLVYAALAGLVLNRSGWTPPEALARAVDLAASAAVPVMLVMLGLELARTRWQHVRLPVVLATVLKLIAAPALALLLAELLDMRGLTRSVSVIEASMPTAVMASLIAVEFDARSDFVTSVVFLSTLGSTVTLVVLLLLLGYTPQ